MFGTKKCLECQNKIFLKIKRDILRKKFCSRACSQKYRFKYDLKFRNMFLSNIWKCNTKEANAKKGHSLENHPKWIKNRTNVKGRPRPEKTLFKNLVLKRDNYKCVWCGSGKDLIADHIKPYALYKDLRFDPSNGRTLCVLCHRKTDTYGGRSMYRKGNKNGTIQK